MTSNRGQKLQRLEQERLSMTTMFLIVTDAAGDVTRVTTHQNRRDAFTYVNQLALDRGRYAVVGEPHDFATDGFLLKAVADHLGCRQGRGERSVVYNLLASRYQDQNHEVIAPPPPIQRDEKENDTMATQAAAKAPKPAKAAKPAKAKTVSTRGKGKPAGKVADFRQVKVGSARERILSLMTGQHTAEQIAAMVGGIDAAKVGAHAFCLSRDCGIGYEYGEGGTLKALFPTGKTLADALKVAPLPQPAKPKAPKAAAAAKPAAKAKEQPAAKKAGTAKKAAPAPAEAAAA